MSIPSKFLTSKRTTWFLMFLIPMSILLIFISNRDFELAKTTRNTGFLILTSSILALIFSRKLEDRYTQLEKHHLTFSLPSEPPKNVYVMSWIPRVDIHNCLIFEGEVVGKNIDLELTVIDSSLNETLRNREIIQIQFQQCRITKNWYIDNQINDSSLIDCVLIFSDLQFEDVVVLLKDIKFKQRNLSLGFEIINESIYVMSIDFGQIPFSVNETASEKIIELSFDTQKIRANH